VQHLGAWYAQAHPTEDFAETFAVWLKPHSAWRREYLGWPAYAKLSSSTARDGDRRRRKPLVADRSTIEDVTHETRTLREHYEQKLARYPLPRRSGADELLLKVFTTAPRTRAAPKAASVLREMRNPLRQQIVRSGAFSEYLVHQVLRLMIERCEALNLYVRGSRRELKPHLLWVIARLAESYEERNCRASHCEASAVKKVRAAGSGAFDAGTAGFAEGLDRKGNRRVAHRIRRHLASEGRRPRGHAAGIERQPVGAAPRHHRVEAGHRVQSAGGVRRHRHLRSARRGVPGAHASALHRLQSARHAAVARQGSVEAAAVLSPRAHAAIHGVRRAARSRAFRRSCAFRCS
jgi:hypothetical protein